jgi:hypothetical protein
MSGTSAGAGAAGDEMGAGVVGEGGTSASSAAAPSVEFYPTFEDVPDELRLPKGKRPSIKISMFPPSSEVAVGANLSYCMRFFPHHNDSGGFFSAVFTKQLAEGDADDVR